MSGKRDPEAFRIEAVKQVTERGHTFSCAPSVVAPNQRQRQFDVIELNKV